MPAQKKAEQSQGLGQPNTLLHSGLDISLSLSQGLCLWPKSVKAEYLWLAPMGQEGCHTYISSEACAGWAIR